MKITKPEWNVELAEKARVWLREAMRVNDYSYFNYDVLHAVVHNGDVVVGVTVLWSLDPESFHEGRFRVTGKYGGLLYRMGKALDEVWAATIDGFHLARHMVERGAIKYPLGQYGDDLFTGDESLWSVELAPNDIPDEVYEWGDSLTNIPISRKLHERGLVWISVDLAGRLRFHAKTALLNHLP